LVVSIGAHARAENSEVRPISSMTKVPVSVLIPTKDEERNLPSTLESLTWADQIVVFDSYSEDGTRSIAERFGCDFFQREFDNFSDHKNWALDNLPFRHPWILILDADEKVSPALKGEIREICVKSPEFDAYYIARQTWIDGVWLKYAGCFPDYNIRLLQKGRARYERRIVHEHMLVDGAVGFLKNPIVHIDKKGTHRYVDRHSKYAEMEAVEAYIEILKQTRTNSVLDQKKIHLKRRRLKIISYKYLIFRPVFVFIYMYVLKLGFVMGKTGLKICTLRMFYEYMIDLYLTEIQDHSSPIFQKYRAYIQQRSSEQ
jgi:glycosyltransferase involved in cell wall biosynthesis